MKSWLLWYVSILWRYDAIRDEEDNWATWCPHMRGEQDACNISKAEGMRKASIRLEMSLFWTGSWEFLQKQRFAYSESAICEAYAYSHSFKMLLPSALSRFGIFSFVFFVFLF